METGEILTLVFTLLTSLVGSSVLTAYLNRRWAQSNKASNILEEQYLKVISPIYRELQLNSSDKEKMISNIGTIIYDNFHLLPERLLKLFKNIADDEYEFKMLIFDFYLLLRYELGYSKTKVSKTVKDSRKLLAKKVIIYADETSSDHFRLRLSILILITIISILSLIFVVAEEYWNFPTFFTSNPFNLKRFLFILICLSMATTFETTIAYHKNK